MTSVIATPPEHSVYRWHRSSHSGETNSCLELRTPPRRGMTRIRDSKDLFQPPLICSTAAWTTFVTSLRDGEFSAASRPGR
ncbi:DUF397 domain-containing protein [Streptomyces alanosinicus]|uniref:DUF397 domain-containing protein n=1 Tax=Streptomyces alanosinicus TaxID=68171 RepID=UPI0016730361|nr:DUF397 domain-containing protein [Streptomyces alanosinicus]